MWNIISGKFISFYVYFILLKLLIDLNDINFLEIFLGWFLIEYIFEDYNQTAGKYFLINKDFRNLIKNLLIIIIKHSLLNFIIFSIIIIICFFIIKKLYKKKSLIKNYNLFFFNKRYLICLKICLYFLIIILFNFILILLLFILSNYNNNFLQEFILKNLIFYTYLYYLFLK